jgi:hypothetical protein
MENPKAPKAYKNLEFLDSSDARPIRILSEYLEPKQRFHLNHVRNTIVFFGSARIPPSGSPMSQYYTAAEELAFRLAVWAKSLRADNRDFLICTGGGPGIMEAANKGASRAGEKSIGLNISLPFEQQPNSYITPELNMEFHYFYMRKLWFMFYAKALIVFPGGFGTMDEFFEMLTLIQNRKTKKTSIPVMLYGREFWKRMVDFDYMVECCLISPEDLELFCYFDSPEEGMEIIRPKLEKILVDAQKWK